MYKTALVPVVPGEKRPALPTWKVYQTRPSTPAEVAAWEKGGYPLAAVTGVGNSDGLVFLDFDRAGVFERWCKFVPGELLARLCVVRTQKPGRKHVWWRTFADYSGLPKNIAEDRLGTLIELRQGGMIGLIPCQHAGGRYEYENMGVTVLSAPVLDAEESGLLIDAARALNERIVEKVERRPEAGQKDDVLRPGDDFSSSVDLREILEPHGWAIELERDGVRYWRRPGKARGVSATEGFVPGRLYVFSTEAKPLECERTYSPFALKAILDYGGDFKACADALREAGYGTGKIPEAFLQEVEAALAVVRAEVEERGTLDSPTIVGDLYQNIPDFRPVWDRKRRPYAETPWRYDYSLLWYFQATGMCIADQARALYAHRKRFRDSPEKVLDLRFFASKLWFLSREREKDKVGGEERVTSQAESEEFRSGEHDEILDRVSRAVGLEIVRVLKVGKRDARYYLILADGRDVPLGSVRTIDEAKEFRRAVANALKVAIPNIPQRAWHPIFAGLLQVAEEVEDDEAEMQALVWDLLLDYVERESLGVSKEERESCLQSSSPFVWQGEIFVNISSLDRFTRVRGGELRGRKDLSSALRQSGFRERKIVGKHRYWSRPLSPEESAELLARAGQELEGDEEGGE